MTTKNKRMKFHGPRQRSRDENVVAEKRVSPLPLRLATLAQGSVEMTTKNKRMKFHGPRQRSGDENVVAEKRVSPLPLRLATLAQGSVEMTTKNKEDGRNFTDQSSQAEVGRGSLVLRFSNSQ
jgi:hypothetical protein